jgi:hypothetical protein
LKQLHTYPSIVPIQLSYNQKIKKNFFKHNINHYLAQSLSLDFNPTIISSIKHFKKLIQNKICRSPGGEQGKPKSRASTNKRERKQEPK